jgi:hypothetical protein
MLLGDITIRPRGERIAADGAVKLVRKASRLTRKGKTVPARPARQPVVRRRPFAR